MLDHKLIDMKKLNKNIIIAVLASLLCLQTCSKCAHDRRSTYSDMTRVEQIKKSDSLYNAMTAERDGLLVKVQSLEAKIVHLEEKDSISKEIIKSLKNDKSNLNNVNKLLLKKEENK